MASIKQTALVYCENQFGLIDGKTAAGLVRHSHTYVIVGIIDSSLTGKDAGDVLLGQRAGIPIFASLDHALCCLPAVPDCYIYGKAPLNANLSTDERRLILEAMQAGMNIVNGLHEFLSDDRELAAVASQCNVTIKDIRRPPTLKDSHVFTGSIATVNIPVIAILGTDCACGKMTTAVELDQALKAYGLKSLMIATGQTSLMQGAEYGISMDALVSQFAIGEIEHAVVQAFQHERPDIILVEGQSSVSHPAFMSSIGILKGSVPDGIILQHPPARKRRCDFQHLAMPSVASEIELIEVISQSPVLGITLSHEGMNEVEVVQTIKEYERRFQLPTTDVLSYGCDKLVQMLVHHFPALKRSSPRHSLKSNLPMLSPDALQCLSGQA